MCSFVQTSTCYWADALFISWNAKNSSSSFSVCTFSWRKLQNTQGLFSLFPIILQLLPLYHAYYFNFIYDPHIIQIINKIYIRQRMSQDCIEYQQYKKIIEQNITSPRRNIFEENRSLSLQVQKLTDQNIDLKNKIQHYKNLCESIIDAIGRVFSLELANELEEILRSFEQCEQVSFMSNSIYEAMATHRSQPTVSDWVQSQRFKQRNQQKIESSWYKQAESARNSRGKVQKDLLQISPSKNSYKKSRRSSSRSPFSSALVLSNTVKDNDPSTNRSHNISNFHSQAPIVATSINCQLCEQTFAPNQFIEHAQKCRNSSVVINESLNTEQISLSQRIETNEIAEIDLQDTQDRKLKKQSDNYLKMMKNLIMIQTQIQQQIQLLRFSKQKIDRDAEKRKLQKDLAKVMLVIEQKKKQAKQNEKIKSGGICDKSLKMKKKNTLKNKNL